MAVKKSKSKQPKKVEVQPLEDLEVLDKAEESVKEVLVEKVCEVKVDPVYVAICDINLSVRKGDVVSLEKVDLWKSQGRDLSLMVKLKK